jgi:hypothetical protein
MFGYKMIYYPPCRVCWYCPSLVVPVETPTNQKTELAMGQNHITAYPVDQSDYG